MGLEWMEWVDAMAWSFSWWKIIDNDIQTQSLSMPIEERNR